MVRFGDPSGMVMTMSEMQRHDDEATVREATAQTAAQSQPDSATDSTPFEPLTATYERLRHSTDSAELSGFARRPLPDRSDQAAFSRATALLEAVAGNRHTPLEDRIMLAETMPFPNILVKLSTDPSPDVRRAVAANEDDKNWLVGRLTKDEVPEVRDAALRNKRTSWKMRLEGAQNTDLDADTLDVLSRLGVSEESGAPAILATMVRRAVALNPGTSQERSTGCATTLRPKWRKPRRAGPRTPRDASLRDTLPALPPATPVLTPFRSDPSTAGGSGDNRG